MRVSKTIILILVFVLNVSCDRGDRDESTNSESKAYIDESKLESGNEQISSESELKSEDSASLGEKTAQYEVTQEDNPSKKIKFDTDSNDKYSNWDWWMYLAIFSLALNTTLIVLIFRINKNFDKIEKKLKSQNSQKIKVVKQANKESSYLKNLENENKELKRKLELYREDKTEIGNKRQRNSESNIEEEKSPEINLSVGHQNSINSLSSAKKPLNLFAEKVTESNFFTGVSEQKNEHRSVFNLILENPDSEKASFEIVDSDFILKMVANSPDTYLYPVCKPENSNQNFSGEIITTKKGIAHKVDGKWKVNEEDKATIKFQ
jgi:hypothetical protein